MDTSTTSLAKSLRKNVRVEEVVSKKIAPVVKSLVQMM
jgi:hypothetical protein